jgi:O-succinylbenzoic acid--CoA ligase
MQDWLTSQAAARPAAIALIAGNRQWTYAELDTEVDVFATNLAARGISLGDKVGALLPNCADYVFLIHALARLGVVLVPLNTRLTASELKWQITHTGCRWLVCSAETEVQISDLGFHIVLVTDLRRAVNVLFEKALFDLNALQAIVFTSGTTGQPKGAMLSYNNHFWSAMASAYRIGTLPDDRWLCCLPLYHVGGLSIVLRCCLYGTTVILQDGFNLEAISQSLLSHEATLISLVPTMLYRMLDVGIGFPPSLRLVLLGGAASSPDLIEQCVRVNLPVALTYGLSEACSQVATTPPKEAYRKPGCVGKPLLFTSIRIVDENGFQQPPGEYGEVVVSGPTVMSGYYGNPEATARTLRDGELYTGDMGYLDQDGDLWLVQRRSDMIVTGGENVYPAEVEQVLQQHSAVAAACVVGVEHPEWGQQVAAAVVLRDNTHLSESELVSFGRQHLAGYKLPRLIRFVSALPQTPSGKIQRWAVHDLLINEI